MANIDPYAKCPDCGALYAVVERVLNSVQRSELSRSAGNVAAPSSELISTLIAGSPSAPDAKPGGAGTYRYRDVEKRKAYMRELMQRRRGK